MPTTPKTSSSSARRHRPHSRHYAKPAASSVIILDRAPAENEGCSFGNAA